MDPREQGYTKVFQDDGSCILLPLSDFDQFVAALKHTSSWEGMTLGGGSCWIRLETVTCVLEVTPEMAEDDKYQEIFRD